MNTQQLNRAFRNDEISAQELAASLQSLFDSREPEVLAFIPEAKRFERLQKDAEELVKKYPDVNQRPALFGMTVGVKDIFHVKGFSTQAGSRLPTQALQGDEAASVAKLKDAGALILGKTVTTEFAYFTPGPTRNPHHPDHTPGGSSSGSAAAVGADLCDFAVGTQTIGSVIRPAAFCGVVGFKPTYERISRAGAIPLSPTFDHVGVFTHDVEAATRVASVMVENWKAATASRKPTLGIPEGLYLNSASEEGLAHFKDVCEALSASYELRPVRVMDDFAEIRSRHDAITAYDAAQVHKERFAKYEALYSNKLADLIKRGQAISSVESLLAERDAFRERIAQTMSDAQVDLWICPPAVGAAPKGLASTGDPVMCLPWTQIGFPAVNLPTIKNSENLPLGLQLVGKWNADESLLAWAEGIEKTIKGL
ncbi:MAG: amidase [Anaerolineaceae bacterium]|nr:amidase [Anaerolineaceae bacterium]